MFLFGFLLGVRYDNVFHVQGKQPLEVLKKVIGQLNNWTEIVYFPSMDWLFYYENAMISIVYIHFVWGLHFEKLSKMKSKRSLPALTI